MLEKIRLYKLRQNANNNRAGFPEYHGCVWGMVKPRMKSQPELSLYSRKYPEIYAEIVRIGKEICDFEFKSIQLNRNLVSPPHKDKGNQTKSVIVSFGYYTGGELVIEGVEHDTRTPLTFDGANQTHWNNPFNGTKYSLIYFS